MASKSVKRQPTRATLALREEFDKFLHEFEDEFRGQATKHNAMSERRMRSLLRSFNSRIYEPYRDTTLNRDTPLNLNNQPHTEGQ